MTYDDHDALSLALDAVRESAQERLYEEIRYNFPDEGLLEEASKDARVQRICRRGVAVKEALSAVTKLRREASSRTLPSQARRREIERLAFESLGDDIPF
jgi:hypothetical protein